VIDDLDTQPAETGNTEPAGMAGWQAPDDVFIQERPGLSPLSPHPPGTHVKNRASSDDAAADADRGRRHPKINDFPPVAQRDYWAKSADGGRPPAEAPHVYQRQPESPPAKAGLFRRWTGIGRSAKEDAIAPDRAKQSSKKNGGSNRDEQVDLPVFFGRGKR
jgi:hypothetical protein